MMELPGGGAEEYQLVNPHGEEDNTNGQLTLESEAIQSVERTSLRTKRCLLVVAVFTTLALALGSWSFKTRYNFSDRNGVVKLNLMGTDQCPDTATSTGAVCICSDGYKKVGVNKNGENLFEKHEVNMQGACQMFKFQVGDVVFFEHPSMDHNVFNPKYFPADAAGFITNTKIVHVGIISEVPPEEENRSPLETGKKIMVTEAIHMGVVQTPLAEVVQRFPFGGYRVRRISPRFTHFKKHLPDITQWLMLQKGKYFDNKMWKPIIQLDTHGRFIDPNGGCAERYRAYSLFIDPYKNGLDKYDCSQLVLWALAFPGGLNVDDYNVLDLPADQCRARSWVLKDLQEWPGKLYKEPGLWDPTITFRMPCNYNGCWLGQPVSCTNSPSCFNRLPDTTTPSPTTTQGPTTTPGPITTRAPATTRAHTQSPAAAPAPVVHT